MSRSGNLSAVSVLAMACVFAGGLATAQEMNETSSGEAVDQAGREENATDAVTDDEVVLERVKVTGTLIPRSTFELPSPVTVVDAEELAKSSPSTLAAGLNNLPALVPGGGPNETSGQRTAGRNFLNLRGMGTNRTLILVNGRRFPGSAANGNVDTNMIPQGLVERVEVVTGGASAAYGSDAVAGVINFFLDTDFEGFKVSGSAGLSEEGDGFERRIGATYGTKLGEGVNFVLSGEYYKADGIDGDARDHRVQGRNLIANPNADGTAANPDLIIAANAVTSDASAGGLITPPSRGTNSLVGFQFLPGGTLAPFDFGINSNGSNQDGGDGVNTAILQPITRPLERATLYAGLDFDLSPEFTAFLNGGFSWSESSNKTSAFHSGQFGVTIQRDNAFLPQSVRDTMAVQRINSIRLGRFDTEYDMEVVSTSNTHRLEAGFEWDINDYTLVVSGQHGSSVEEALNYNNFVAARYAQGVDAVLVNGQIVCRDPSNGCVPINPFGVGSYTQEMIDYFTDTSVLETHVDQLMFQATLTGDLFDGIGAGPWQFALGAQHREDDVEVIVDPISEAAGFFTNNFRGWNASRDVDEFFGEIYAPLISGQPGVELLDLNLATRHTEYTFSGGVDTWKVGLNYRPDNEFRIRGSLSRDIRAPALSEMFNLGREGTLRGVFDEGRGEPAPTVRRVQRGNPDLTPEVAETIVLGFVYEPSWIPGFSLSLDRFDIRIENAIDALSGQDVVDQCHLNGIQQACDQLVRAAPGPGETFGVLQQINNSNFNIAVTETEGWDLALRYTRDFAGGDLSLRSQVGHLETLLETDGNGIENERVGDTSIPAWRALGSLGFKKDNYDLFLQGRYVGEIQLNNEWTAVDSEYNDVDAAIYLDAQFGYELSDSMSFFLNVQNLLDKEPLFAPQQDTYFSPTNPNLYDQVGRQYRIGFRATF